MSTFMQVLITGLGRGAVYALLALGFVLIYKATEVINFAHASLALVGGYMVFVLEPHIGWFPAAVGGILCAGLLALIIERVLINNAKLASHDSLAIMTIGLDTILFTEIIRRLGVSDNPNLFPSISPLRFAGISIQGIYLASMITALVLIGIFIVIFRKTNWGTSMRAQSENKEAASLMGIRSGRVTASAWFIGGCLAGVSVLFIASPSFAGSGLSATTHSILLVAFPAVVIGGLTSIEGAIVGGVIVGLTNSFGEFYVDKLFATVAVYVVMVLVLFFKPSGLFGKVEQRRV